MKIKKARTNEASDLPQVYQNFIVVKLNKVLSKLNIVELKLAEADRRRVVQLVFDFLDAFTSSQFDIGRPHLIRHRIDTQDAPPFKEIGRLRPLEWRSFLDQDIDRLLALGHISEADPGVCPYASHCDVVRRKMDLSAFALTTDALMRRR